MALCGPYGVGGLLYDPLDTRPLDHLAPQPQNPNGANVDEPKYRVIAQKQVTTPTEYVNAHAESKYAN